RALLDRGVRLSLFAVGFYVGARAPNPPLQGLQRGHARSLAAVLTPRSAQSVVARTRGRSSPRVPALRGSARFAKRLAGPGGCLAAGRGPRPLAAEGWWGKFRP